MGAKFSSMAPSQLRNDEGEPALAIFGYGSLLWNPGFAYDHQQKVIVRGYSRRFYQGNTNYRGTEDCPGRVVTLVEDEKSHTYGVVFTVIGRSKIFAALEHLYEREIETGYYFEMINAECLKTGEISRALTFIASPNNRWFLGPPVNQEMALPRKCTKEKSEEHHKIALDIATARGRAGPNCEYLFKLADSMRKLFPDSVDEDLFQLETFVMAFLGDADRAL